MYACNLEFPHMHQKHDVIAQTQMTYACAAQHLWVKPSLLNLSSLLNLPFSSFFFSPPFYSGHCEHVAG